MCKKCMILKGFTIADTIVYILLVIMKGMPRVGHISYKSKMDLFR